jgi:hypothetical protein
MKRKKESTRTLPSGRDGSGARVAHVRGAGRWVRMKERRRSPTPIATSAAHLGAHVGTSAMAAHDASVEERGEVGSSPSRAEVGVWRKGAGQILLVIKLLVLCSLRRTELVVLLIR